MDNLSAYFREMVEMAAFFKRNKKKRLPEFSIRLNRENKTFQRQSHHTSALLVVPNTSDGRKEPKGSTRSTKTLILNSFESYCNWNTVTFFTWYQATSKGKKVSENVQKSWINQRFDVESDRRIQNVIFQRQEKAHCLFGLFISSVRIIIDRKEMY